MEGPIQVYDGDGEVPPARNTSANRRDTYQLPMNWEGYEKIIYDHDNTDGSPFTLTRFGEEVLPRLSLEEVLLHPCVAVQIAGKLFPFFPRDLGWGSSPSSTPR